VSTIGDPRQKVARLRDQLKQAERSLEEAQIAAAPVKVGDVVVDHRGEQYRVTGIEPKSWGGYWLMGNPRKKDGEWSRAERRVYDWKARDQPTSPEDEIERARRGA
jgi:hypothetical protein